MSDPKPPIPSENIITEIRELAVIWGDAYSWDIWNIQKLASDIQNVHQGLLKKEMDAKINTPQVLDFTEGVKTEIAHQYERWGDERNVPPHHFSMVLSYLIGKLNRSIWDNDKEKFVHHLITIAAVSGCAHKYLNTESSHTELWFREKKENDK